MLTQNAARIKKGYTHDPECSRTTHRLRGAMAILAQWGATPEFPKHADDCMLSEAQRFNKVFGCAYHCTCHVRNSPEPTWPEWVTDECFNAAANAAEILQTARGDWNKAQAAKVA